MSGKNKMNITTTRINKLLQRAGYEPIKPEKPVYINVGRRQGKTLEGLTKTAITYATQRKALFDALEKVLNERDEAKPVHAEWRDKGW